MPYKPPQIALIGTKGAGKTVLTTVWATMLSKGYEGLVMLGDPGEVKKEAGESYSTKQLINKWYDELESGKWVKSTDQGELIALQWKLTIKAIREDVPFRMFDSAGQDLKSLMKLYNDTGSMDDGLDPKHQKLLDQHLNSATILLILLNPRDFLQGENGIANGQTHRETKDTIETVFNFIRANKPETDIAFIVTAWDQYGEQIEKQYGGRDKFIKETFPTLYALYIEKDNDASESSVPHKDVPVFCVAAVNDTKEGRLETGQLGRVPKEGFGSFGLDKLTKWLRDTVVNEIETSKQFDDNEKTLSSFEKNWERIRSSELTTSQRVTNFQNELSEFSEDKKLTTVHRNRLANLESDSQQRLGELRDKEKAAEIDARRRMLMRAVMACCVLFVLTGLSSLGYSLYWRYDNEMVRELATESAARAELYAEDARRFAVDANWETVNKEASKAEESAKRAWEASKAAQTAARPRQDLQNTIGSEEETKKARDIAEKNLEDVSKVRDEAELTAEAALGAANNARTHATDAKKYAATARSDIAQNAANNAERAANNAERAANDAEKIARDARERIDINLAQTASAARRYLRQAQDYEKEAATAMNVAKENHDSVVRVRDEADRAAEVSRAAAVNARIHATNAREYAVTSRSVIAQNAASDAERAASSTETAADSAERNAKDAKEKQNINLTQTEEASNQFQQQAENFAEQAAQGMRIAQAELNAADQARASVKEAAQNARRSANNAKNSADQADCPEATKAAEDAEMHALRAEEALQKADESNEPQQYLQTAQSAAAQARINAEFAREREVLYQIPRPETYQDWTATPNCTRQNRGTRFNPRWVCVECRAIVEVSVRNNGGAGEITIRYTTSQGQSFSVTEHFERHTERKVQIPVRNLQSHPTTTSLKNGRIDPPPTQR